MKKKLKTILLVIITIIAIAVISILISNYVFKEVLGFGELYPNGTTIKREFEATADDKKMVSEKLKLVTGKEHNLEGLKGKEIEDKMLNKTKLEFIGNDFSIEIDKNSKDFISYIIPNKKYEKCNMQNIEIENIAKKIFSSFKFEDKNDYKFNNVYKFDDEIWSANFTKEYDGLKNKGEAINISFSPVTSDVMLVTKIKTKFENNDIKISKEDAIKKAQQYIEKENGAVVKEVNMEIVNPNNYFIKTTMFNKNKNRNKMRRAYVITLNNGVLIYVDATTGKVIGGDSYL